MNSFEQTETLYKQGLTLDELKQSLAQQGYEGEALEEQLRYIKKLKMQKQVKLGFNLIVIGAFICASSCVATFFHSYSATYTTFSLYGLTFVGAGMVMAGLACVFGF